MTESKTPPEKGSGSSGIQETSIDDICVFHISGYCTGGTGEELWTLLEGRVPHLPRKLVWDFSKCGAVNSPGIVSLLEVALRVVDDFDCRLVMTGLTEVQIKVFELAPLLPLAEHAPTIREACQLLRDS